MVKPPSGGLGMLICSSSGRFLYANERGAWITVGRRHVDQMNIIGAVDNAIVAPAIYTTTFEETPNVC